MIDHFIESRKNESSVFFLENDPFSYQIKDKELIAKFKVIADQSRKPPKPLLEILIFIADNKSWDKEDEQQLLDTSSDDFFQLYKSINSENLDKIIKASLAFTSSKNSTGGRQDIQTPVKEALVKIGQESALNAKRVSKYGILVE